MIWHNFLKTDNLVAVGLVITLILSLFIGNSQELSMSIASGLIGYIGRGQIDKAKEHR